MLNVVGIGPGNEASMTAECREALMDSDIIVGYTGYADLVRELMPQKEFITTGMGGEEARVRKALELSADGARVSLVCSGDAGVYGLAGLALELAAGYPGAEVRIVAGVTAALAGSALLGSALGNDFCVISLSDLLTPWEAIEKRLECAAAGDFCIALYNPSSKGRPDHLAGACAVLMRRLPPETACGYARNTGRAGEEHGVMSLGELASFKADMFTTVFVGSSATKISDGRLITGRGYRR